MPVLLIMIGIGGMIGAYLRFQISGRVSGKLGTRFPWGTLAVNLSGSFALGLVLPLLASQAQEASLRALVTVGVIGAFTTFSTFAYEALMLIRDGHRLRAAAYVSASLGLGLLAIALGLWIGQSVS